MKLSAVSEELITEAAPSSAVLSLAGEGPCRAGIVPRARGGRRFRRFVKSHSNRGARASTQSSLEERGRSPAACPLVCNKVLGQVLA